MVANTPLVSILLPVYNGAKYLRLAIQSVLAQDYPNFEVIAINDGSSDESLQVLQQFEDVDPRVRVISRENRGLIATLDELIEAAKGDYLARMDCDDICEPGRLRLQVNFLSENPKVDVVGGVYSAIDSKGRFLRQLQVPSNEDEFIAHLCFSGPFAHPSIMARRRFFDECRYKSVLPWSAVEDFALWCENYCPGRYGNVPSQILQYRIHTSSFSFSKKRKMRADARQIRQRFVLRHAREIESALKSNQIRHWIWSRAWLTLFTQHLLPKSTLLAIAIRRPLYWFSLCHEALLNLVRTTINYIGELKAGI